MRSKIRNLWLPILFPCRKKSAVRTSLVPVIKSENVSNEVKTSDREYRYKDELDGKANIKRISTFNHHEETAEVNFENSSSD